MNQYTITFRGNRTETITGKTFPEALADYAQANGNSLKGLDLSGCSINGLRLVGVDLTGVKMDKKTVLTGAHLIGCTLNWAEIDGANLAQSVLVGSSFRNAKTRDLDLTGATIELADFRGARLAFPKMEKLHWSADGSNDQDVKLALGGKLPGTGKYLLKADALAGSDLFAGAVFERGKFDPHKKCPTAQKTLHSHIVHEENIMGLIKLGTNKVVSGAAKLAGLGVAVSFGSGVIEGGRAVSNAAHELITKAPEAPDGVLSVSEMVTAVSSPISSAGVDAIHWFVQNGFGAGLGQSLITSTALLVVVTPIWADLKYKFSEKVVRWLDETKNRLLEKAQESAPGRGVRGLMAEIANNVRVLRGSKMALHELKGYLDAAARTTGSSIPGQHRMIAEGPGAVMTCTRKNLAEAMRLVSDAALGRRGPNDKRPLTLLIEENIAQGPAGRPAWLTFQADGGFTVACAGADGKPSVADRYGPDGVPQARLERDANGAWQQTGVPPLPAADAITGFTLQLEAWNRDAALAAAVEMEGSNALREFDYNPETHYATRAADGVLTVRNRLTHEPDNPMGYAVYGNREDGTRIRIHAQGGTVQQDFSSAPRL